jgi:hypothetical protein
MSIPTTSPQRMPVLVSSGRALDQRSISCSSASAHIFGQPGIIGDLPGESVFVASGPVTGTGR